MRLITTLALILSTTTLAASGNVPSGMPNKLSVGLFEDTGKTWMKNSGVKWDFRYRYLTHGWANNWGYSAARDGAFAQQFMTETGTQGFIPAFSYYTIYDIPPANTGQLKKMQNVASMTEYFNDFRLLMQQAKAYGKPVLVMVEPDATGFLQGSAPNPNTACAVASTGIPELAGLPNTCAGWGMAFTELKNKVGATNVILGLHVSGWASGVDLFHSSSNVALEPEVGKVYNYLLALGLNNYDVLIADPLDRDADYYKLVRGEDRWWDPSDTAAINTKSFNRYAEWLKLWNIKSNKRWILWQIPVGNSGSSNVCNHFDAQGGGYKDNRAEYFYGPSGAAHRTKFVESGVISLLFGAGEGCQTTQETDNDFLKKAVLAASGTSLNPVPVVDAGTTCMCPCACVKPDATPYVDAGAPYVDAGNPVVDAGLPSYEYNFTNTTHGFVGSNTKVGTALALSGMDLAVIFTNAAANTPNQAILANPVGIPKNKLITFKFFIPSDLPAGSAVQVFVQENSVTSWKWIASWVPFAQLQLGDWNTLSLTTSTGVLQSIGIEYQFGAAYTGVSYIDSITWNTPPVVIDAGSPVVDAGVAPKPDAGSAPVDAGTGTALRVMPLGDSITEETRAWRCELLKRMVAGGYNPVFVGSVNSQYETCPFHEGHGGYSIFNIESNLSLWLTPAKPDVIVLTIGTNDLAWWTTENGTQVAARLDALIGKIRTQLPNVKILVNTIPPQSSAIIVPVNVDRAVLVNQYNERMKVLVANRKALGQKIELSDINSVLALSDLRDGIHPTPEAGIAKMAPVMYNGMVQLLK